MAEILGSFASALITTVMDRISGQELKDFLRGNRIDDQHLQNLKMNLLSVSKVLDDAEEKQFIDPHVKEWVDNLRNAMYDADDLLDEIVTKAKYRAKGFSRTLKSIIEQPLSKVEGIVERLKILAELKDVLGLKEGVRGKLPSYVPATSSLEDESQVYGRNVDREKIIDFLLSENSSKVGVVVIVGMRGIGKTALAQVLYNDERVVNNFEAKSWASVSDTMNLHEITKDVLESFKLCQPNVMSFNPLQILLKRELARKKFLVVIDGFANENYLDWNCFLRPFLSAKYGSKIIITTRSTKVATEVRADLTHSLPFLSHEDSWKLLSYHAFMSENPNQQSCELTRVGLKIVKRCGGLPLALITLGSLLFSKVDTEEWENVCNSTMVDLSRGDFCYKLDDSNPSTIKMNSVRHISYLQGVYDEVQKFQMYSDCKLLRTFLPFKFAPFAECDYNPEISNMLSKTKKLRVLSLALYPITTLPDSVGGLMHLRYLDLSNTPIVSLPDFICSLYNLETLLLMGCVELTLLPTQISNLVNLRQLDIRHSSVKKMPANFGKLKSLQLLPLFFVGGDGGSNVSELGDLSGLHGSLSIVNLQNVLTGEEASNAGLMHKKYLHEIKFKWTSATHNQEIENIVIEKLNPHPNLRRLQIHGFGGDKFPSWRIENSSISSGDRSGRESFTSLQELHIKRCPNLTGKLPDNLPSLTKLVINSCPALHDSMPLVPRLRELNITNCETFVSLPKEMMEGNQDIQSIVIENCSSLVSIPVNGVSRTISCLEISGCRKLQLFHPQMLMENSHCYPVLKRLHLKCSCDSLVSFKFSLFPKIEDIFIEDCRALETILSTVNSLPYLQKLTLKGCSKLALFPEGEFPAMPSLTSLHINGLPKLTSLDHIGIECLTSLKELMIEDCINLESLPPGTSLFHLKIKSCPILQTKCEKDTGKYWSMVSLITMVEIED